MSKIENNRIYYDPYNEIRCDKFALEKFVKESEEKDKIIADLEAKLAEKDDTHMEAMQNALNDFLKLRQELNQTKIEFAIAQLEKIKDKFREIYDKNRKHHLSVVKCYELVDEQITELSNENERNGE